MSTTTVIGVVISLGISLTGAAIVGTYRWLRGLRKDLSKIIENHLPHIQLSMEAIPPALERQTTAIVSSLNGVQEELREQRQDLRTLTQRL